jgi:hypothetical protein
LGHWNVFSRNDRQADSERFYNSILEFLEDEDEETDVVALLEWWNRYFPSVVNDKCAILDAVYNSSQIFPAQYLCGARSLPKSSALAKLRKQRGDRRALGNSNAQNQQQ